MKTNEKDRNELINAIDDGTELGFLELKCIKYHFPFSEDIINFTLDWYNYFKSRGRDTFSAKYQSMYKTLNYIKYEYKIKEEVYE